MESKESGFRLYSQSLLVPRRVGGVIGRVVADGSHCVHRDAIFFARRWGLLPLDFPIPKLSTGVCKWLDFSLSQALASFVRIKPVPSRT
jgi:hypothetical protein